MGLDHSADQNHLQSRNHPGQDETTYGSTIYHNAMGDYFLGFSDQHKEGLTAPKEKSVEHLNGEHSDHKSKKPHPPVGVPEKPPTEARPYVLELSPTDPNTHSAHCDPVMKERLNNFSKRVEDLAEHMKLGSSMSDTVKGKLNLGAEIVKKGGKENLFKEKFNCDGHEKLLKACACHLSTTTGPIGGLLFISNKKIAFCSDRSLIFTCPSGGIAWSYYRVSIPIGKIGSVSPCENVNKPAEKYIRIQTVDNFEFWFMGFVNIQKAYKYVHEALKK